MVYIFNIGNCTEIFILKRYIHNKPNIGNNIRNKLHYKRKYICVHLYAEACNEKGLAIAGLNFPDNACYTEEKEAKINITPFELIPWILGNYASVEELKKTNRKS